ncbi:MAG: lysostaphin resistance A-like protein [Wenzhouxiangella sp.]
MVKIILLEAGLGVLAIVLALLFGLAPWLEFEWTATAWLLGLAATVPMVLSLLLLRLTGWHWLSELEDFVRRVLVPWFGDAPWWGLALVALAAGIGEELLFRGVVQGGLAGLVGPWGALVIASLLFGLVHAMTRAYFIIATLAGFYLGLLYLWTGNLLIPIVVHFLYDWIALQFYMRRYRRD